MLDAKARAAYRQAALVPLHQMNNMQHVVHALGASRELRAVGEGWLEQHKVGWQGASADRHAAPHEGACCGVWAAQGQAVGRRMLPPACNCIPCIPAPQGQVEAYQRQYMEAAWGPLLALLRLDARQPLPAGLAGDRSARQAVKDKWTAVNKTMGEAQAQQVRCGGPSSWGLQHCLLLCVAGTQLPCVDHAFPPPSVPISPCNSGLGRARRRPAGRRQGRAVECAAAPLHRVLGQVPGHGLHRSVGSRGVL